ncbi:hypothetical protein SEA_MISCHIEF19_51 [Streptomyces phage Mischief19]|nr:hypothetical protein SEA_MISCHIEF19_51 [Streptomyces phage Mischief19]
MMPRKLNVSTGAGGKVMVARNRFDAHIDACADCQPHMCHTAEALWRTVCLTALRAQHAAAPVDQTSPSA